MEYSEASNFITNTANTNPKLGSQAPLTSFSADPDSDLTLQLRKELENKQLYLKEAGPEDEEIASDAVEVEKVHEELEKQLHLNEDKDKHLIELSQDDDFNSGESNDGEERNINDKEDNDNDEVEKKDERSNDNTRHQYPVRPEAEDCSYYMRTGTCKFGSNCKFNHPVRRRNQYYLRTGGCKYGKACRYNHSREKSPVLPAKIAVFPVLDLNFLGLPIRLGEKECLYYMRNGSCKYGANCRFNHPDPTAVGGSDPPSAFSNGGSATFQSSPQSSVGSWSSPRGLNEIAPFVPVIFPATRGVTLQNPEWNGYQVTYKMAISTCPAPSQIQQDLNAGASKAPVYPPERSIHLAPAYVINNLPADTNVYGHQQQTPMEEFPERPGQPECSYYMKTGNCKFKSNCKYHHPKNQIPELTPFSLSDKGLPLRPGQHICSYYSQYGICRYGPACKFDHPIQAATMTGSAEDRARMSETGYESDTAF
ncbi:zinc finger CCCH domain-containing protein 43 isoform X2 [Manihot esculenta]|uniref:zinc finger CCCH domain-containing protein 43 isoform X2 n=1 Tax=Manihot esculenta TaxID=3983 RepID=UPI001CC5AB3E|nr:zinc finger CCCH domain-containing protein 43 isoform X2 [Manihot esculenta]